MSIYYDGELYFDENEFRQLDGWISEGDVDKLHLIAQMNNLPTRDLNRIVSFIANEYYREHNVGEYIKATTGKEYKDYSEFIKLMNTSRKIY